MKALVNPVVWVSIIALAAVVFILTGCQKEPPAKAAGSSVVKIIAGPGHGSGVSIGNGVIITARHVVGDLSTVKVKTLDGQTQDAEVLWTSSKYDIAYLKASDPAKLGVSKLACRDPEPGERIRVAGNPGPVEFVIVRGHIAGDRRSIGPWSSVVVTDITTIPGQSGGPVFDANAEVVGIVVGVMVIPLGFGGSLVGVGYAVPGATVCGLIARVA